MQGHLGQCRTESLDWGQVIMMHSPSVRLGQSLRFHLQMALLATIHPLCLQLIIIEQMYAYDKDQYITIPTPVNCGIKNKQLKTKYAN